ncbi:hypothetical protein [Terracoccus luteus]|uniref:Uncharacterized protein n=2 Tax=Terracoccus luteus TaxID=53356 RepID=A0A839PXM5_9MICO|nr:hypothetical protein [Terracoccus luteus]MBB2988119.1 hypothetical protein [Terracoccus luteus]
MGPLDLRGTVTLLERALSSDRMSGLDWYRLSGDLGRTPTAVLLNRDWRALFERCLLEMAVSLDLEYALREEALARLAGHPQSGPVIAAIAQEALSDPTVQVYNDTTSLLMYCDHPDAGDVLLDALKAPTNNDALRAALIGMTSVVRSSTDRDVTGTAAQLALSYLRDEERPLRVRRQAANLLRALDLPGKHRLAVGLHAHDLRYAATILLEGRALERRRLQAMAAGIREALLGAGGSHVDPVLDRMIRTALEDSDDAARGAASRVLMLVPQRPVIATELARELAASRQGSDWLGVQECLEVLVSMARADDMETTLELLVEPGTPPEVAMLAGIVLGNAQEDDAARARARHQRVYERALAVINDPMGGLSPTSTFALSPLAASTWDANGAGTGPMPVRGRCAEDVRQVLRGLVYVLGMHGRVDLIDQLAAHTRHVRDRAPASGSRDRSTAVTFTLPVESAAHVAEGICRWWLELPGHVQPLGPGTIALAGPSQGT